MPSSELAGMNELEGSVLLEADDYRKLFNEVKALKTALLRLKRELQEDVSPDKSGERAEVGGWELKTLNSTFSVFGKELISSWGRK